MAKKPKADAAAMETKQKKPRKKTEFVDYQSFHLQRPIKGAKVTGSFRLIGRAFTVLGRNWKLFAGIVFWYALLNVVLVQGFQVAGDLDETKSAYEQLFTGDWAQLAAGVSLFAYLLGSTGEAGSAAAASYQLILALLFSLVLIWALRQVHAGKRIRVRDGFYLGMGPLVPFILVLLVIALQLLPMVIGGTLYGTIVGNGIAVTLAEHILWAVFFFMLAMVSLYMIASSLFALYIVTLPGMAPLAALRSARQLVRYRRFAVLRKVIFLPIALVVLTGLLVIPLILFVTPVAGWVLFAITMVLLPVMHSYMYALYRALI